jgi:hypothetical protein
MLSVACRDRPVDLVIDAHPLGRLDDFREEHLAGLPLSRCGIHDKNMLHSLLLYSHDDLFMQLF